MLCVFAAFLMAGCGGDDKASEKAGEKIAEKMMEGDGKDVDVDIDGDSVKIKGKDGESSFSASDELPDDWPDDVPFPDDAKVTGGGASTTGGQSGFYASATTGDSIDDVMDFYKEKLDGYKQTTTYSGGGSAYATYSGAAGTVTVTVAETDGKTNISLAISRDAK